MNWSVPRDWKGETCVVIAGGPSLANARTGQYADLSPISFAEPRPRVITINDSWRLYPWADVFYFCDASWWWSQMASNPWTVGMTSSFAEMIDRGLWVTAGPSPPDHPKIHSLKLTGQRGFETCPHALRHGSNSGYQAIHLAAHFGARRIILLGYDMRTEAGRTHWHDGPRDPEPKFRGIIETSFLPHFPSLAEPLRRMGVEVINATPDSGLKVWPFIPLEEALKINGTNHRVGTRLGPAALYAPRTTHPEPHHK